MAFGAATAQALMVQGMGTTSSSDGVWAVGSRAHQVPWFGVPGFRVLGSQEHPLVWCFPVSLQRRCVAEWPRLGPIGVVGMCLEGNVAGKGWFPNGSSQWRKHLENPCEPQMGAEGPFRHQDREFPGEPRWTRLGLFGCWTLFLHPTLDATARYLGKLSF